jgi:hypothetical protein
LSKLKLSLLSASRQLPTIISLGIFSKRSVSFRGFTSHLGLQAEETVKKVSQESLTKPQSINLDENPFTLKTSTRFLVETDGQVSNTRVNSSPNKNKKQPRLIDNFKIPRRTMQRLLPNIAPSMH